jgi:hypothetical protein
MAADHAAVTVDQTAAMPYMWSENSGSESNRIDWHRRKWYLSGYARALTLSVTLRYNRAMCINIKVFDAIVAHGRGVTLEHARALLPAIPRRASRLPRTG